MPQRRSTARTIFHFIYNSLYFLLCLCLAALVLISPADAIRQAYFETKQYSNIVIIAIAYLVSVFIVLFVYSLRLYVTRTVLASIPKSWVPVGKGDVGKGVSDMVKRELGRSAAIAWEARPKSTLSVAAGGASLAAVAEEEANEFGQEASGDDEKARRSSSGWPRFKRVGTVESEMGISLPPTKPVWGEIEHPGWGSPNSNDLPNVQYGAVLSELPNLIEGKAISLAPLDMGSSDDSVMLDPDAVALLQRNANMGMRSYIEHLVSLAVVPSSTDIAEFLDTYERARFSTRPMPAAVFRRLMHLFAEILQSTQPLDRSVLNAVRDMDGMYTESEGGNMDIDDDAPLDTSPTTPNRSLRSFESNISSDAGASNDSIRRSRRPGVMTRNSSGNTWGRYGTAPTTPKSKAGRSATVNSRDQMARSASRSESARTGDSDNSFAQTRRPFVPEGSLGSASSSAASTSQVSVGSVIRLALPEDDADLPYVLRLGDTL